MYCDITKIVESIITPPPPQKKKKKKKRLSKLTSDLFENTETHTMRTRC